MYVNLYILNLWICMVDPVETCTNVCTRVKMQPDVGDPTLEYMIMV